jgi:hypothetical protein
MPTSFEDLKVLKSAEVIADSVYKYHFGEKIQFLYYARGSVFETKYWLNRAIARGLMAATESQEYAAQLTNIARQLNLFVANLKGQRSGEITVAKTLRENPAAYYASRLPDEFPDLLFDDTDLNWLQS